MPNTFYILASHQSAAEKMGELIGGFVMVVILLAGIIKCIRISMRKTTSAPCVLSLALILGAFLLSGVNNIISNAALPPPYNQLVPALFGILMAVFILAAVILAIVGLVLYRSPRHEPYTQGKAQAVWALCLSLLPIIIGLGIGVYSVLSTAADGNYSSSSNGEPIENEDLNFQMEMPGKGWVSIDPKAINESAAIVLRKRFPDSMFILIAEKAGTNSGLGNEALVEVAKSNLKSVSNNVEITDKPSQTINGIEYNIFQTRAKNFNGIQGTIRFEHRVTVVNGYSYQLAFMVSKDDEDAVSNAADQLTKLFSQLDPERVLESAGPPVEPARNEAAGFSVDLSEKGWSSYDDQETDFPEAIFAASKGINLATGINTVRLDGMKPNPDRLAAGFLHHGFSFSHPSDTRSRREVTQGPATGIEVFANREVEGVDYVYAFRSLFHKGSCWLISAWSIDEGSTTDDTLREILDEYQIFEPTTDPKSETETEAIVDFHAGVINAIGIAYYEAENHQAAIPYFEEAFRRDRKSPQYFKNSVDSHTLSLQYEKALARIDSEPELLAKDVELRIHKAESHAELEQYAESQMAYETVFAGDFADEGILLDYLNVLIELDKREDAITVLDQFREKHPKATSAVERWKAHILGQLESYEEAIEILAQLHQDSPADLKIATSLIQMNLDAGNYSEGLEQIETLLADGTRSSMTLFLKGRAKLGLNSYREAKEAFEEADKLSPGDAEIADYLDHTATLLGKSNIALIKDEIEEVSLPSELAELSEKLRSKNQEQLAADFGVRHLRRMTGHYFKKGEPEKVTYRREVEITDTNGLDRYSTLRFGFDPAFESLYVNELTVLDENGEVVARGETENYFILDDNGDGLADTNKTVHAPVPGLKVGHTIRYTLTRQDFKKAQELDYVSVPMGTTNPSVGEIVYFLTEKEDVKFVSQNGVEKMDLENGIAFYTDQPPIRYYETMQPWAESFAPWLTVGSSKTTWKKEVEDYLERLDPILKKDTEAAAAKAKEVVGNAKTDKEKIERIFDYVSHSLSYQGIEFGPRGQIPDQFSTILKNRYGDCKDHSLMLVKLLRAAGIDADLALVSYDAPIKKEIPTLDQFDHMIAYISDYPGSPFFDGTADHFPAGKLTPSSFLFEQALIMDPANPRLEEIKPTEDSVNIYRSNRHVKVDPENPKDLVVDETLTLDGYPATWLRNSFHDWKARDYAKELTTLLRFDGSPSVTTVSVEHLKDPRKPLEISMSYRIRGGAWKQGQDIAMRLPAVWESYFLEHSPSNERHNPFEIFTASEFESTCKVTFPEGYRPKDQALESFSAKIAGEKVEWTFEHSSDSDSDSDSDSEVNLRSLFKRETGTQPAEKFDDYTQNSNSGVEIWKRAFLFQEK